MEAKNNQKKFVKVVVKNLPESPLKLRLIADMIRGMNASVALEKVQFLNKKGALYFKKALSTGIANAKDLYDVNKESLIVSQVFVDEAQKVKRYKIASRSRVAHIMKRKSHINLILSVK